MSLLNEKNFQTRAVTGILFVGVIVACIFIHTFTFFALLLVINFFCLKEFYDLTLEKGHDFFKWYCIIAGLLPCLLIILPRFDIADKIINTLIYFISLSFFAFLFLQLYYSSEKPFTNIAFAFLGIIYTSVPLGIFLVNVMHFDPYCIRDSYNPWLALLLFLLVWINDTGAYITGKLFGKTKLFERISPKKTWEGTIGGVFFCMMLGALYGKFVLHESLFFFCGLGLIIGVFSTLGDLVESQLKRSLNIKDSSTMLPGHGGFLDRFDGFLMAMPAAYFYILLIR